MQQQKRYFSLVCGSYLDTHSVFSQTERVSEMLQHPVIKRERKGLLLKFIFGTYMSHLVSSSLHSGCRPSSTVRSNILHFCHR